MYFDSKPCAVCDSEVRLEPREGASAPADAAVGPADGVVGDADTTIDCDDDQDVLRGNGGSDRMSGGTGRDTIRGNAGRTRPTATRDATGAFAEIERRCES